MLFSVKRLTLFTVSLALFMDVLDTNIINTSIPAMAKSLQVNPIDLKIALISYLLTLAIFIPTSGWAADKYGAKPIFILAFGLFTISSFFCGYAHSLTQLVIARSFQGVGGAFMISLGRLMLARTFKRHELVEAMNAVIIVVSVAVMLGPFIGGTITDYLSWPWIFWVNIPIGIFAMLLAIFCLQDNAPKRSRPFDAIGFILFGGSLSLLCYSLAELSESNANIRIISLLIANALLMLIFYFYYAKQIKHPIVQTQLFQNRPFRISVTGNLCARLGFGGMPFLLPLLQQLVLGFDAQLSGLLLAPMAVGIVISKLMALRILRYLGYKRYLMLNTIVLAIVISSFQIIHLNTSAITIACLTFILGLVISLQFTGMNSLALADITEEELSSATSITSTVQILAQTLGVAVSAILLRLFLLFTEQGSILTLPIFQHTFLTMSIFTALSALIFFQLKHHDGRQMLSARSEKEGEQTHV